MTEPAPLPWPPGTATGVGSLPGEDPLEAARTVVGELPDLPHLPELPGRGPGADLVGRTAAAVLAGLEVDLQPAGWRLVDRPGVDARRARGLLSHDLDALEEAAAGYRGPVKVQACGPWTLAASVELPRGGSALADAGASRDLAAALAEGAVAYLGEVRRRLPGAHVLVQLDEPSLPAVLRGAVPTASGFGRVEPVDEPVARDALGSVLAALADAGGWPLVHCCASDPPIGMLRDTGARAVSLDVTRLAAARDEELGELAESGVGLLLGCVPSADPEPPPSVDGVVRPVLDRWRRIGLSRELLGRTVATPTCGLAGASPGWARRALELSRDVARALADREP